MAPSRISKIWCLCVSMIWTLLFQLTSGSLNHTQAQDDPADRLYDLFDKHDEYHDLRNEKPFPDVLPDQQRQYSVYLSQTLEALSELPFDKLERRNQINHQVFKYIYENRLAEIDLEMYLIPFNAEGGFYNRLTGNPAYFANKEDYEEYGEKLTALPQFLRDNIQLMRLGMEKGIVSPRLIAENYKVLTKPYMEMDIDSHLLFRPYLAKPDFYEQEDWNEIRDHAFRWIKDSILTSYQYLDSFMARVYLPAARSGIGIYEVTRGKEWYEQRIAYYTSLDLSPEDVFTTGQKEVERIRKEMQEIIESLAFQGSFEDFVEFLRTDDQFYAKTPRDLLKEASYFAKRIDGILPKYFNRLPTLPYGVEPVPAAIAPNYTGGRYSGGSWENNRAGSYWVNTYKLSSRPLYVLPSLTLHEAVPGHHLQISLAKELDSLPRFRNQQYISAFGEGWALYTEWLGKEMGIYETPYQDFGRLTYEMWRACRLVVDVGMHYKGWTRDQAFAFLSQNTALSLHECNTEIDRYIGWPGQAVSYKIGELKIKELRKLAEEELGSKFDLRSFHDTILENGSIPLFILEDHVRQYIQKMKTSN